MNLTMQHLQPADDTAIVIACSLGGNTPETVAAAKLAREKGAVCYFCYT